MARKLTKAEVASYNGLLFQKRNFLTGNIQGLEDGVGSTNTANAAGDMADQGSDNCEQDLSFSVLESQGDIVQRIDEALQRLVDGSYGKCQKCEKPITKARLKAIPWTPFCIECQRREEAC